MARVTAAQALKTRERLLDAALEVFWEEGVSQPSLTKVAERAGMTRGAIYGHFDNRHALFRALCDRHLLPAEVLAEMRDEGADDPLGTLVAWVSRVLRDTQEQRERRMFMEILFLKCEAVEGDELRQRLQADSERARHHEEDLLRRAVDRGQLPADLDVGRAALAVHALLGGLLRYFALNPDRDATPMVDSAGALLLDILGGAALRRGDD